MHAQAFVLCVIIRTDNKSSSRKDSQKIAVKKSEINSLLRANGAKVPPAVIARYIEEAKRKIRDIFGFDVVECNIKDVTPGVAQSQDPRDGQQAKADAFILINALPPPVPAPRGEGGAAVDEPDPVAAISSLLAEPLPGSAELHLAATAPTDFHLAMIVMGIIALER
jgi:hypothetical protein